MEGSYRSCKSYAGSIDLCVAEDKVLVFLFHVANAPFAGGVILYSPHLLLRSVDLSGAVLDRIAVPQNELIQNLCNALNIANSGLSLLQVLMISPRDGVFRGRYVVAVHLPCRRAPNSVCLALGTRLVHTSGCSKWTSSRDEAW